jgi:hypothetical protein
MREQATRQQLESDLQRWRAQLPQAQGTYCQGIANKAFGIFELLLKQLLAERLAKTDVPLLDLLVAVRYGGNARTVEKLPPGTLVAVLLRLAEMDDELGSVLPPGLRQALRDVVPARNNTTHEVLAPQLRERARRLLDLIHQIVTAPELATLLP